MSARLGELDARATSDLLRRETGIRVLDVREAEEHAVARLDGALLATPAVFREVLEGWSRDTPVLVYCHHGIRSRIAGFRLLAAGFTQVYNLSGGIEAWSLDVDPAVPRYAVRYGEGIVRLPDPRD